MRTRGILLAGLTIALSLCRSIAFGQDVGTDAKIIGEIIAPHFKYGNDSLRKYLNREIKAAKIGKVYLTDLDDYTLVLTISESGKLIASRCLVNCQDNEKFTEAIVNILGRCEWVPCFVTNAKGNSFVRKHDFILLMYFDRQQLDKIVRVESE